MYQSEPGAIEPLADFQLDGTAIRYSHLVPRLYNLCCELGMRRGRIMPSRAFCADESQGYPIILIAKHFGTFPFNHGQLGGIVATDRHGPHAHHGQDLVIVQASHVGYEPESGKFGHYRRLQTTHQESTASCGKICGVLGWYRQEYSFAQEHILLGRRPEGPVVVIDNQLLKQDRDQGLMLNMPKLVHYGAEGQPSHVKSLSTAKVFRMADELAAKQADALAGDPPPAPIGNRLTPDLFYFRRDIKTDDEGQNHLEVNLIRFMPQIVTSPSPPLTAAKVNTQIEFDRTYRTLVREPEYRGKRLLFVSGLNVDVSPSAGRIFPLTKFIPWAAYWQQPEGQAETWEQIEVVRRIRAQRAENPDQIDIESSIRDMEKVQEVTLRLP